MDPRLISAALVFSAVLMLGLAAILLTRDTTAKEIESRVLAATRGRLVEEEAEEEQQNAFRRLLFVIGRAIRARTKIYSERDILVLEGMISGSGMNAASLLPVILGLKAVLALSIPAIGFAWAHLSGLSTSRQ